MDAATALAVAFGVAFVAELGDKSQFILLGQATRAPPVRVVLEAAAAFAVLTVLAVTVGAALAPLVPSAWALVGSGVLFAVFAGLAWRDLRHHARHGEERKARGTFLLILVAEFGDRTQVATAALAVSTGHPVATGLGAWLALATSSLLAVLVGAWLGPRLDVRRRTLVSIVLYAGLAAASIGWGLVLLLR